jgi:hypothetical protein
MAKKKNINPETVDKRLVDRFLERGDLSRGDLDGALKKLPDLEGEMENIADVVYAQAGGNTAAE